MTGVTFVLLGFLLPSCGGTETPRDLIAVCTSARAGQIAYCDGYIEGATHIWKFRTACDPSFGSLGAYCFGLRSAKGKILESYKTCKDCNAASFASREAFEERMHKFREDLKAMMGVCSPDDERDSDYCDGYNAEVNKELAELSAVYGWPQDPWSRGLGEGAAEAGAIMVGTTDFFAFEPCVKPELSVQEMKRALLQFVRDNPEQERIAEPVLLLQKALFYGICPGPQLALKPHVEQCTEWGYHRERYVAKNTCDRPLVVRFQSAAGTDAKEALLKPGDTFRTGLTRLQIEGGSWIYTVCPVGHVSSVPFLPENADVIFASHYSCVSE